MGRSEPTSGEGTGWHALVLARFRPSGPRSDPRVLEDRLPPERDHVRIPREEGLVSRPELEEGKPEVENGNETMHRKLVRVVRVVAKRNVFKM